VEHKVEGLLHSPQTVTVVLNADDDFYPVFRAAAIRKGVSESEIK